MSPHRQSNHGPAWTVVVLAAVGLAAVVSILILVPDDDSRGGQVVVALTAMITSVVGATYAAVRVERRINESDDRLSEQVDHVDGQVGRLLDQVPGPDTPGKPPPSPRPPA